MSDDLMSGLPCVYTSIIIGQIRPQGLPGLARACPGLPCAQNAAPKTRSARSSRFAALCTCACLRLPAPACAGLRVAKCSAALQSCRTSGNVAPYVVPTSPYPCLGCPPVSPASKDAHRPRECHEAGECSPRRRFVSRSRKPRTAQQTPPVRQRSRDKSVRSLFLQRATGLCTTSM